MYIYKLPKKIYNHLRHKKTTAKNPLHNDFYVVEFPKSGITWLSTILANMALISSGRKEIASYTAAHLFVPDIHITRNIGAMIYDTPPVRFIKSHAEFNPNYNFVIYLARHPLDVMKSYYRFLKETGDYSFNTFDDFCRSNTVGINAWKKHVNSWFDGTVICQRVHLCRYENFLENPESEIELISTNFGWAIDPSIIKIAIEQSSLQFMKDSERLYKSRNPRYTMTFIGGDCDFEIKKETISYITIECENEMKLLGYF